MIVKIYCEDELEILEMPIKDVQTFIDLIEAHGYEDADGEYYKFKNAQVEYPKTTWIYVEKK
jgi:hypothetical protein